MRSFLPRLAALHRTAPQGLQPCVHVYSAATLSRLRTLQVQGELGVTCLAFSADGDLLAVCGDEPDPALTLYRWAEVRSTSPRTTRGGGGRERGEGPLVGVRDAAPW